MKKILFIIIALAFGFLSVKAQTWSSKADIPGVARRNTVGFSINGFGYVCQGGDGSSITSQHFNDLYQYNPSTNTWSSKANFPGTARRGGIAFTVDSFAYVGLGWDNSTTYYDLYQYDPTNNLWDTVSSYPGDGGREAFAVADSNFAYVGGGQSGTSISYNDFWQFNPDSNSWVQKASFPFGNRANGVSFSHQENIYMGLGNNRSIAAYNDFWQFNLDSNKWVQKANFPGRARMSAVHFEINGKFIVGGGSSVSNVGYDDYYQYDPLTDTWDTLGNFSIANYSRGAYFSLRNKGYAACGYSLGLNTKGLIEFSTPITTSLDDVFISNPTTIKIYPNPTSGIVSISGQEIGLVSIYDIQGKLRLNLTIKNQEQEINLNSLENGLYLIHCKSQVKKIIINR